MEKLRVSRNSDLQFGLGSLAVMLGKGDSNAAALNPRDIVHGWPLVRVESVNDRMFYLLQWNQADLKILKRKILHSCGQPAATVSVNHSTENVTTINIHCQ